MSQDKTRDHVIVALRNSCALLAGLRFLLSRLRAGKRRSRQRGRHCDVRTKCAMCHGPDGAGSEVGKSMNVPDLRSAESRSCPMRNSFK